ncbi:MAG: ABC transporter substrate binding protein [Motiliproteus sp.]
MVLERLERIGQSQGFDVIPFRTPADDKILFQQIRRFHEHSPSIDALYLPMDSYLLSRAEQIGQLLLAEKIPALAAHQDYIRHGALLGLVPDYREMGTNAASIIIQHQQGTDFDAIGSMQIKNPRVIINQQTLERLDLKITEVNAGNVQAVQ